MRSKKYEALTKCMSSSFVKMITECDEDPSKKFKSDFQIFDRYDYITGMHKLMSHIDRNSDLTLIKPIIEKMIEIGYDINQPSSLCRMTPFHMAIINGNKELIEFLFDKGGDITLLLTADIDDLPVEMNILHALLHYFNRGEQHVNVIKMLIEKYNDKITSLINGYDSNGLTPLASLMLSCCDNWVVFVDYLIEKGFKLEYKGLMTNFLHEYVSWFSDNPDGWENFKSKIDFLVEKCGIDINEKDRYGNTILSNMIIMKKRFDARHMEHVINHKSFDISVKNIDMRSYIDLMFLKRQKFTWSFERVLEILIEKGVPLNNIDNSGRSTYSNIFLFGEIDDFTCLGSLGIMLPMDDIRIDNLTVDEFNYRYDIRDKLEAYSSGFRRYENTMKANELSNEKDPETLCEECCDSLECGASLEWDCESESY